MVGSAELRKREHESKTKLEVSPLSESLEKAKLDQVCKWVWILETWSENNSVENDSFWFKIGSGFEEKGGTPHQEFPEVPTLRGSGAGCKPFHDNKSH